MTFEIVQHRARPEPAPPLDCDCCAGSVGGPDTASEAFRRAVLVVLALNAAMFVVEIVAGQLARSMALQADALDFAGDTATYSVSLFALTRSARFRTQAAQGKSVALATMGVYVVAASLWRTFVAGAPEAVVMGWVGALALAINVSAALILLRFRDGDANARSVWLCSRNDALGNGAVLFAALVVGLTRTRWADLGVAVVMASLFLSTAFQVFRQASAEVAREELRLQGA